MMHEADFAALLHLVERLSLEQRTALGRALAATSGESEAIRLLEEAFLAAPRCPHCAATAVQRWGYAIPRRPAAPARARGGRGGGGRPRRPAPLPLPALPQDLQCPDRHLPGAAAQEGVLAGVRRGARGRHDAGAGGGALRRAYDDQLPLAAPLPQSAGSGAGGARRRGRGRRDLFSPLVQRVPTMAPSRRTPRATSPPAGRARRQARALGGAGPGLDRP